MDEKMIKPMKKIIYILCLLTVSVWSVNTTLLAADDPFAAEEKKVESSGGKDIFDEEAGEKFNGCFTGKTDQGKAIELLLKEDGEIYTGKLFYNGRKYPVEAELDGASLSGVAGTEASPFAFTFRRSSSGYLLKLGEDTVRMQEAAFPDLKEKWEGAKVTLQADSKSGDKYSGRLEMRGERMSFSGTVKDGVLEGEISLSDGKKRPFTLEPEGKNLLFRTGTFTDELETMLKENFSITLANGVTMDMIWIEPGTFMMGSPVGELGRDDDETQHRVTLTKGYWLGKYEVTQEQYKAIMGNNPSKFAGNNLPVEQVSWDDAMEFCRKLTDKLGDTLPKGYKCSLPTEAQWEYACRAGTTSSLNSGKNVTSAEKGEKGVCDNLDEVGWYWMNGGMKNWNGGNNPSICTHPGGMKKPNAWGLYDMHGNVCEWCLDAPLVYTSSSVTDPKGSSTGKSRVFRGGSWDLNPRYCRSALRFGHTPDYRYYHLGFRLALVPVQ